MSESPKVVFPKDFINTSLNTYPHKGTDRGSGGGGNNGGGDNMSYVSRGEFNQYEKRIDKNLNDIEGKIDNLPNQINKDMKILLNDYDDKRRKGNWAVVGWILTGVSIIVTVAGIVLSIL